MNRKQSEVSSLSAPPRRQRTLALAIAIALGHVAPSHAADFIWLGGAGNFNTANWSSPGFPNAATADLFIDGGNALDSTVDLNVSSTIGNLSLDLGDTLNILESRALTINGSITNNGTLSVNGAASFAQLLVVDAVTLGGTGETVLADSAQS
ncbi:hypothetical protein, partial [Hydrogenophaga sp.]|uniref:hypothetical protein n=1 Tax=Hydrogenophaga sp. TaxID=1904254 RepID=UPI003D1533AE